MKASEMKLLPAKPLTRIDEFALRCAIDTKWNYLANTGVEDSIWCPLCILHAGNPHSVCGTCPVKQRTGEAHCHDTPYIEWERGSHSKEKRIELALEECKFLERVLREGIAARKKRTAKRRRKVGG